MKRALPSCRAFFRPASPFGMSGSAIETAARIEACGLQQPRRGRGRSHRDRTRSGTEAGFLWEGSSDPDSGLKRSLRTAAAESRPRPLPRGSLAIRSRSRGLCGRGLLTPTAAFIEACGLQGPCRGRGRSHRECAGSAAGGRSGGSCGRGLLTPTAA